MTVDPLREALERIAAPSGTDPLHREYAAVKRLQGIAREALAAAPVVEYEYRAALMDRPEQGGAMATPDYDDVTTDLDRAREGVAAGLCGVPCDPYDDGWVERRTVGPWERVQ